MSRYSHIVTINNTENNFNDYIPFYTNISYISVDKIEQIKDTLHIYIFIPTNANHVYENHFIRKLPILTEKVNKFIFYSSNDLKIRLVENKFKNSDKKYIFEIYHTMYTFKNMSNTNNFRQRERSRSPIRDTRKRERSRSPIRDTRKRERSRSPIRDTRKRKCSSSFDDCEKDNNKNVNLFKPKEILHLYNIFNDFMENYMQTYSQIALVNQKNNVPVHPEPLKNSNQVPSFGPIEPKFNVHVQIEPKFNTPVETNVFNQSEQLNNNNQLPSFGPKEPLKNSNQVPSFSGFSSTESKFNVSVQSEPPKNSNQVPSFSGFSSTEPKFNVPVQSEPPKNSNQVPSFSGFGSTEPPKNSNQVPSFSGFVPKEPPKNSNQVPSFSGFSSTEPKFNVPVQSEPPKNSNQVPSFSGFSSTEPPKNSNQVPSFSGFSSTEPPKNSNQVPSLNSNQLPQFNGNQLPQFNGIPVQFLSSLGFNSCPCRSCNLVHNNAK